MFTIFKVTDIEEPAKPRYHKHMDIESILIEEKPGQTQEIQNYEPLEKVEVMPKPAETVIQREVKEVPSFHITENDFKIGQLDVTELQNVPEEPTRVSKKDY